VDSLDNTALVDTPGLDFRKRAGDEPLPGYRLIQPLGCGSFGEVWKCEVPGRLIKAIKFVNGNLHGLDEHTSLAQQELAALERIKSIRHPFILSMERVEVIDGELLIVMELADKNLQEVLAECQAAGLPGIPREELFDYLLEAAEALDLMNFQHGLQHLDVKPRNLFLVSNHLKVADFGLVNALAEDDGCPQGGGFTPLYSAPEILNGQISRHSDQYSLAIVYQELLTGTLPFQGTNGRQLMLQHLTEEPNLDAVPAADRPWLARALAKDPAKRFPSCTSFIQALLSGSGSPLMTAMPEDITILLRGRSRRPTPAPKAAPETLPTGPGDVRDTPTGPRAVAPTGTDAVPGHQLLECLSRNALAEAWRAQNGDSQPRLAYLLSGLTGWETEAENLLAERLQALRHPALLETEVLRSSAGRVVLVTDLVTRSLRDRLNECRSQNQPGIPRADLLGYVGRVAEALDALYAQHGVAHFGLNPRNLLLRDDQIWIGDFGLVALVWVAAGQCAGPINERYAAPELFDTSGSPASDQYSLALIYAEMLTGVHPRRHRSGSRTAGRTAAKLDLDMLPAGDRAIIARALHSDPACRFPTCTEFVRALESGRAEPAPVPERDDQSLPPVIPFASLLGDPAPPGTLLPSLGHLVEQLTAAAGVLKVYEHGGFRYRHLQGDILETTFAVRIWPGVLRLRLDSLRQQWGAEIVHQQENAFVLRLHLEVSFLQRCVGRKPGLEVCVQLQPAYQPDASRFNVLARVQPFGGAGEYVCEKLFKTGPVLFESLRHHLQALPEQRANERWPCRERVQVYAVLAGLELAEALYGETRDISREGVGLTLPQAPASPLVYLHFEASPQLAPFALLAQIMWSTTREDGRYDIGAAFE
jgi:serine/threonine protein kinase